MLVLSVPPLAGCGLDKMEAKQDHETGQKYGFEPGTTAFAPCMKKESIDPDDEADKTL